MKRIQNKIAESRYTLPMTAFYGVMIWLLAGLLKEQWWVQFGCFLLSVYVMMQLNNQNLLIRIYSRTVSSAFIVLSCIAVFLFPSMSVAVSQLCIISALLLTYRTYLDKESPGIIFYAFLCLSLASLVEVRVLFYVPVFWLVMAMMVYSMSWRTFLASLIGILTPYWFCLAWYLYQLQGTAFVWPTHFDALTAIQPIDYTVLGLKQTGLLGFLIVLGLIGSIHFVHTSYQDKIRVREIYYSFMLLATYAMALTLLQPQLFDLTAPMLIITISPLIAHYFALTHSRFSNILFFIALGLALTMTALNLWIL